MEYTQITLDQWATMKEELKQNILNAQSKIIGLKKDFVRIGYSLRKIDELKLYEKDGYKSIAEFAKEECKLTDSDVTRFMQINKKYSIGGYSEELCEEFLEYGQSKLTEMLALPDSDMEMMTPAVSREGIRELKRFNKSEPIEGVADDLQQLVEKFYEANEETLNELYSSEAIVTGEVDKMKEIVNPSGNKVFKKGLFFLMMYENDIKVKKYGTEPQTLSWADFFDITNAIFGPDAAGKNTYKNHFGSSEEEQIPGQMETHDYPEVIPEDEQKPKEKEDFAPAQKSSESPETLNAEPVSKTQKIEKTEEQKYAEEQAKIDRQTKKKLQEMEDAKRMEVLPCDLPKPVHSIRIGKTFFADAAAGIKPFTLRKNDRNYQVGDILEKMEFDDGKYTGRTLRQEVIYKLEEYTGLVDGYCILGVKNLEMVEKEETE